jgi:NADH-quinone oxidoreductase subunit M
MLTFIILLPLVTALALTFVPRALGFGIRLVTLASTCVTMLAAVLLFLRFDPAVAGYQFVQSVPWVSALKLSYHVGVDGLNVGLVLMAAVVAFAAACVSWEIKSREKEFYILLLVMSGGVLGAFASLDLFFFYAFHELALVPTFIMIGVWGRGEGKNYATFQITLYLSLGALIALAGLIALYLQMPEAQRTFDLVEMTAYFRANPIPAGAQHTIFALLLFGFGILVSLWPFHTWAPPAYAAAPSATAMLHAGALKKFGLYGLIRVGLPLLPAGAQSWMNVIALLCLGNILHVGWVAMRQRDLGLLAGNSSVAHMGFVFLGIASLNLIGVTGAVLVMIAHGFLAALTFALNGYLQAQTGTLQIGELGGLLRRMPFIGAALIMAMMAGCGVPGFANFAGEVTVLFGAWKGAFAHAPRFVALAAWGALVIGAIYMMRAIRDVLHGEPLPRWATVKDAGLLEKVPYVLLLGALLVFGFFPRLLTDRITPVAQAIVPREAAPPAAAPVPEAKVAQAQATEPGLSK